MDESTKNSGGSAGSAEQRKPTGAPGKPWPKGTSGNPKGRPRDALSTAIREVVDPRALIGVAIRVIEDPKSRPADRLAAVQYLSDRGYTKPAELHEVAMGQVLDDERDLSHLTMEQLVELEQLEARRAELLATSTGAVPAATPLISDGNGAVGTQPLAHDDEESRG